MHRRTLLAATLGTCTATLRAQPVTADETQQTSSAALALVALLDAGRFDEAASQMLAVLGRAPVLASMMPAIEERLRHEFDKRRERGRRSNPRVVTVAGRGGLDIFSVVVEADAEQAVQIHGVSVTKSQEVVQVQRRAGGGFEARRYEFKH